MIINLKITLENESIGNEKFVRLEEVAKKVPGRKCMPPINYIKWRQKFGIPYFSYLILIFKQNFRNDCFVSTLSL